LRPSCHEIAGATARLLQGTARRKMYVSRCNGQVLAMTDIAARFP
jgi:hypothetical protein